MELAEEHQLEHPLVVAVESREDAVTILQLVQHRLARAAAELDFMAQHPEDFPLEDARHVTRRVRALKRFSELIVAELRAAGPRGPGPESALGRQVVAMLADRVVQVAEDVLPKELARQLAVGLREAWAADPNIPWS